MIEQLAISHSIQKYIMNILKDQEFARFSDLRPSQTDTNVFSYHLKVLMRANYISKHEKGYTLDTKGLKYADRATTDKVVSDNQPAILTMLLVQNSNGDVLIQQREKQPYINTWTLPYGKIDFHDKTIIMAAARLAHKKLGRDRQSVRYVGDAYIRVSAADDLLSVSLAHIFRFECDDLQLGESLAWVQPHKLSHYALAPAIESIIARCFFNDAHFFEEYSEQWNGVV